MLAVDDPAGIVLVGDLGATTAPPPKPRPETRAIRRRLEGGSGPGSATGPAPRIAAGFADPAIPEIGIAGIVLVSLASLVVTLLRRERMRRRLSARIADRLAALVGGRRCRRGDTGTGSRIGRSGTAWHGPGAG